MRNAIGALAIVGLWLAVPNTALAFDESGFGGDFSSSGAAPTVLPFVAGTNPVTGNVNGTGDVRDWITFTVPVGQQLTAIRLVTWTGNRGYTAIKTGTSGADPSGATTGTYLGGDHTDDVDDGIQLIPSFQDGRTKDGIVSGTGFTPPLGAGSYTYLVQQTSPGQANPYRLEFTLAAPAPAVPALNAWWAAGLTAMVLATGVLLMRRRNQYAVG